MFIHTNSLPLERRILPNKLINKVALKRLIATLCFAIILTSGYSSSEAAAPDFIIKDTKGVEHQLYDYLQQGKSVILNFSSTWCKPCWNYKQSGVLDDLWNANGPDGINDVVILFLEADDNTCEDCLYGQEKCNDFTYGDWTSSPYPSTNLIGDNRRILERYNVTRFPSIYAISSLDYSVKEMGQLSLIKWKTWLHKQSKIPEITVEKIQSEREIQPLKISSNNLIRRVLPTQVMESLKTEAVKLQSQPVRLDIFPNPCSEKLNLEFSDETISVVDVSIYSAQGAISRRHTLKPGKKHVSIDLNNLKGGAYFVVVNTGSSIQSKKLLIIR